MTITFETLKKICPSLKNARAVELAKLLNELSIKYGLTSLVPYQMFLANVAHESGEFAVKSENMRYTTAERIRKIWPSRFPTIESAHPYVNNANGLANKVYGGRMGNTEENDGWVYRGAGFIQLTGKEMHTKYSTYIGHPLEECALLVRTIDRYALDSAMWFFCVHKKLIPIAETGNFKAVVKRINGGYIGLDKREKYLALCKKYLT